MNNWYPSQLCLNGRVDLQQRMCEKDQERLVWALDAGHLSPKATPGFCLDRENPRETLMAACHKSKESQVWQFFEKLKKDK